MPDPAWEEIEHTADVAIHVTGVDLTALFENAARGMLSLLGSQPSTQPARSWYFSLDAPDLETLLVDWLTELLYLIEDDQVVFSRVEVSQVEGLHLEAEAEGNPGGAFVRYIKAVTYHNLAVDVTPSGCQTTIVFDV